MKRSIISQYDQLKGRLSGYVAMMNFRYMNLCIKAEEASLIPITVMIEGEGKRLEDVARIAKDGEYDFKVFPIYDEDLFSIGKGIAMAHPEFKQDRKNLNLEMDDGEKVDVEYLQITMPDVDKNRYDLLKETTNAMYEQCKVQMEAAKTETESQIALMTADEKENELDKLHKALKELNKTWTEKRDQLHEDKLKEIEDAYARYQQQQAAAEQKLQEDQQAKGDGGMSLDMSQIQ